MGLEHKSLLLYSKVRWSLQRKILTRLYELQNEVYLSLTERKDKLSVNITDSDWLRKLLYLSCILRRPTVLSCHCKADQLTS